MAVTFNAFNPMTWWTAPLGGRFTAFPSDKTPKGAPIDINARASDPGIKVASGSDSITLSGETKGPGIMKDIFGFPAADLARSVSFTLDIDNAPTKDLWGNTDYTEKNSRIFTVMTRKGQSAGDVADALAAKVNRGDDFKASVERAADGSATLRFTRR